MHKMLEKIMHKMLVWNKVLLQRKLEENVIFLDPCKKIQSFSAVQFPVINWPKKVSDLITLAKQKSIYLLLNYCKKVEWLSTKIPAVICCTLTFSTVYSVQRHK